MVRLADSTVRWALEHLQLHRENEIFPRPFEYHALYACKEEVVKYVTSQDIETWQSRTLRRCLVPKQRYGFRVATQLDPLDMLFYTALFIEVGEKIEQARLPAEDKTAFSYRFLRDAKNFSVFDDNFGYEAFQNHSLFLAMVANFVVVTDIADFYPRIYLHRLENALDSALGKALASHSRALVKLIKGWNQNVSYGIPVGNNPSRLLAEIAIDDVDRNLQSEKVKFVRYVDDFRIFCDTKEQAHSQLAQFASLLYENHGLTLQTEKTRIITVDKFIENYLKSEEKREIQNLDQGFDEMLAQLGIVGSYEQIKYNSLDADQKELIDNLNLEQLLNDQLEQAEIDVPMSKFLINRLALVENTDVVDKLLKNPDLLFPVFQEVINYLSRLADNFSKETQKRIGETLLDSYHNSVIGQLEFHRHLIVSLFSSSNTWVTKEQLLSLYKESSSSLVRSSVLQAIGKYDMSYWLRQKKTEFNNMSAWEKRAFIYAASCFPTDELKNYYRAIKSNADPLEKFVIEWAQSNPININ